MKGVVRGGAGCRFLVTKRRLGKEPPPWSRERRKGTAKDRERKRAGIQRRRWILRL